jgi:hypothetical protein
MAEPPVDDPSVDPVWEPVPDIVERDTEEPKLESSVDLVFDPIEEPVGAWSILESDSVMMWFVRQIEGKWVQQ